MIQRADLHMHGPIGLQPYWLKKQGYAGRNPLQLIADEAFKKDITICAITSHSDEIPKGSVHDRFGCLKNYEAPLISPDYEVDTIGENILSIRRNGKSLTLLNGQTAIANDNGNRYDVLIVGSNRVPNNMSLEDTLKYSRDNGLITIAEHPLMTSHGGMGRDLFEKYADYLDAVEYNSQVSQRQNDEAMGLAQSHKKTLVANSDAHRIEDLGTAYGEWVEDLNITSESSFFTSLKKRIIKGEFLPQPNQSSLGDKMKWIPKFLWGIKFGNVEDVYIPSNKF